MGALGAVRKNKGEKEGAGWRETDWQVGDRKSMSETKG